MPKQIIKDTQLVDDNWIVLEKPESLENLSAESLPEGQLILPVSVYNKLCDALGSREVGVWLDSDEPDTLIDDTSKPALIAINFPAFADGRGYSYAHILRMQRGYKGELRAIGDVLRDQLFYMKRVGFNSFAMRDDQKLEEAVANLADFTEVYQGAVDEKSPLFARR